MPMRSMKPCSNRRSTIPLVLSAQPFLTVRIDGSSMEPSIAKGDSIAVKKAETPVRGHCYLFECGERILLHRLVLEKGSTLFFMGDDSRSIERVPRSSIVAELASEPLIRRFGRGVAFVNTISVAPFLKAGFKVPSAAAAFRSKTIHFLYRIIVYFMIGTVSQGRYGDEKKV